MSDESGDGAEWVGCWVLERDGCGDRYFGTLYPGLAASSCDMRVVRAWWCVDTGAKH